MKKEVHKQNSLMAIVAIVAIIAIVSLVLLIKKPAPVPDELSSSDANLFQEILSIDSEPGNIAGQALSQGQQDKIQAAFDVNPQKVLEHIINKWSPEKIARFVKITTRILALPRSQIEDILQNQLGLGLSQIQPFIDLLQFLLDELTSMDICGNTKCDPNETPTNCPTDCDEATVCGNGVCESGEDLSNCLSDCLVPSICGDGNCDQGEDFTNCPVDCPSGGTGGGGGGGGSVWSFINGNLQQNPVSPSTKPVKGKILWDIEFECLHMLDIPAILGADTEKVIVVKSNREFPPDSGPLSCSYGAAIFHGLDVISFDITDGTELWKHTIKRNTDHPNNFGMRFLYGAFYEDTVVVGIFQQPGEQLDVQSMTGFVILNASTGQLIDTLDGKFMNDNPIKIRGIKNPETGIYSGGAIPYWPILLNNRILYYSSGPYGNDDISSVIGVDSSTKQVVFRSERLARVKISITRGILLASGFEPIVIPRVGGEAGTAIDDPRTSIIVGYNATNGAQQFRRADQSNDLEGIPRGARPMIYGDTIYVIQRFGQFGEIPGLAKIDIDTGEITTIVDDANSLPIAHFFLEDIGISSKGLGATDRQPEGVKLALGPVFDGSLEIYRLRSPGSRAWVALNRNTKEIEWILSRGTPPIANKNLVYTSIRRGLEYQLKDAYGLPTGSLMRILDIKNRKVTHWAYEGGLFPEFAYSIGPYALVSSQSGKPIKPMLLVDEKIISVKGFYRDFSAGGVAHPPGIIVLG